MFAFAAAIVFGAFTLASCGNDDDDNNSSNKKHIYTPAIEIITSKEEYKASAVKLSKELTQDLKDSLQFYEMELTEAEATRYWNKQMNENTELAKYMQASADDYGRQAQDMSLKCKFKLMQDGTYEFRYKEWLTQYWLKVN